MKSLIAFFREEQGAGMVEYGLLVALIALGLLLSLGQVRDGLIALFQRLLTEMAGA